MKKNTLIKVAELAGVGIATVDRVLNERGGVRPETVRKVLRAARQAGLQRLYRMIRSTRGKLRCF